MRWGLPWSIQLAEEQLNVTFDGGSGAARPEHSTAARQNIRSERPEKGTPSDLRNLCEESTLHTKLL